MGWTEMPQVLYPQLDWVQMKITDKPSRVVKLIAEYRKNEYNEIQPIEYHVYENDELIAITTDFLYALRCFVNHSN